ncbi:MAG: metallophosphoesterase [Halobacteriaceae archaeon]
MAVVEPIPGKPAATASIPGGEALVVADYHAGIEQSLRADGLEVESRAERRRERLLSLVDQTGVDRVVFLGDLAHDVGRPSGGEIEELTALLDALPVPATLVKGNHDGAVEAVLADGDVTTDALTVTDPSGVRLGAVGFVHGHTWPASDVLSGAVVCVGHEHPAVRIEDEVGGARVERAWLRGPLDPAPFQDRSGPPPESTPDCELIVFPAFNDRSGGTWVNVPGQSFLAPFLPAALRGGQVYLLDGTRLGEYAAV